VRGDVTIVKILILGKIRHLPNRGLSPIPFPELPRTVGQAKPCQLFFASRP